MKETLNYEPTTLATTWSLSKKLLFLFVSIYLFLYMFPFPIDSFPLGEFVFGLYNKFTESITKLIGSYWLGIYPCSPIEGTGSGDTTFDYVKLLTMLLMTAVATIIVFAFTRKRTNYTAFYSFMLVYARYYLAFVLIGYGVFKILDIQFPLPNLTTLEERFGSASPMRLLWTFMGYSKTYTVFTAWLEIIAGTLLWFRKTTVLGCIIGLAIMLNVVMLNLCYDVPVKIHSSHLVFVALFILSPNYKRLFNFFVLNKTTEISAPVIILPKRWMQIARLVLKPLLIMGISVGLFYENFIQAFDTKPTNNLNATYKTTLFVLNKDTLPPLLTNENRWDKMIIEGDVITFYAMKNRAENYLIDLDTVNKIITKKPDGDTGILFTFKYKSLPNNCFSISGKFKKDSIYSTFTRKSVKDYPLISRGFHWVNEYDNNN
jgi:hypothetical protein